MDPLVWNKKTGNLVGGHQRFKILVARGDKAIECSIVDLDEPREKALNLTLSSPEIQGEFEGNLLASLLSDVEAVTPDVYDSMELALLKKMIDEETEGEADEESGDKEDAGPPEMELLPYEHYDYLVLFFKDIRDWMLALDEFGIQKVKVPAYTGKKKIGLGRVLDGAKFMARLLAREKANPRGREEAAEAV